MSHEAIPFSRLPERWKDEVVSALDIAWNKAHAFVLQENSVGHEDIKGVAETIDFKVYYEELATEKVFGQVSRLWVGSEEQVENLKGLVGQGVDLDPVILDQGVFLDGGHRTSAHHELGLPTIKTLDIQDLMAHDWASEWTFKPRQAEKVWRVPLFDGRGGQCFLDEDNAREYFERAKEEGKDPSEPEHIERPKGHTVQDRVEGAHHIMTYKELEALAGDITRMERPASRPAAVGDEAMVISDEGYLVGEGTVTYAAERTEVMFHNGSGGMFPNRFVVVADEVWERDKFKADANADLPMTCSNCDHNGHGDVPCGYDAGGDYVGKPCACPQSRSRLPGDPFLHDREALEREIVPSAAPNAEKMGQGLGRKAAYCDKMAASGKPSLGMINDGAVTAAFGDDMTGEQQEELYELHAQVQHDIEHFLGIGPLTGDMLREQCFEQQAMTDDRAVFDQVFADALADMDRDDIVNQNGGAWQLVTNYKTDPIPEDAPEAAHEVPGMEGDERQRRLDSLLDLYSREQDPERKRQLEQQMRSLRAFMQAGWLKTAEPDAGVVAWVRDAIDKTADVESRAPLLVKQFPSLFQHNPGTALPFLKNLADAVDPTGQNGKYLAWILKQIAEASWPSPEQYGKAKDLLKQYDKAKGKKGFPEDMRDINRLDVNQVVDAVQGYGALQSKQEAVRAGTKVKFDGPLEGEGGHFTVTEISTPEAAAELCKNTGWCVVNPDTARDYLSSGPLVKIDVDGEPWALWSASGSLEGPNNEHIDDQYLDDVHKVMRQVYPPERLQAFQRDVKDHESSHDASDKTPLDLYYDGDGAFEDLDAPDMRMVLEEDEGGGRFEGEEEDWADKVETLIRTGPWQALNYLSKSKINGGRRWPQLEQYILGGDTAMAQPATAAAQYAMDVIRQRWPQAEHLIYSGSEGAIKTYEERFGALVAPYKDKGSIPDDPESQPGFKPHEAPEPEQTVMPNAQDASWATLKTDLNTGERGGDYVIPAGSRVSVDPMEGGANVRISFPNPANGIGMVFDVPHEQFNAAVGGASMAPPACLDCGKPEEGHQGDHEPRMALSWILDALRMTKVGQEA